MVQTLDVVSVLQLRNLLLVVQGIFLLHHDWLACVLGKLVFVFYGNHPLSPIVELRLFLIELSGWLASSDHHLSSLRRLFDPIPGRLLAGSLHHGALTADFQLSALLVNLRTLRRKRVHLLHFSITIMAWNRQLSAFLL